MKASGVFDISYIKNKIDYFKKFLSNGDSGKYIKELIFDKDLGQKVIYLLPLACAKYLH